MSWSGQLLATNSIVIAATNDVICLRVTGGVPTGTAFGPITRTM